VPGLVLITHGGATQGRAPRAPTVPADDPGWSPRRRFFMSVVGETQLRDPNNQSPPAEALTRRAQTVRWSRILLLPETPVGGPIRSGGCLMVERP